MRSACAPSPKARTCRQDLRETLFGMIDALCDKPLINLESADESSLPGAGGLAHAGRARDTEPREIRAELGLSSEGVAAGGARRRRCTWPRCAAWRWSWRAPRASPCRRRSWTKARRGRSRRGRLGHRDRRPRGGARGRERAVCQGMGQPPVLRRRRGRCAAARGAQGLVRARTWFAARLPDAKLMHCLPVRRNVAVADEVLDGPRAVVRREAFNRLAVQMAVLHRMLA